jgi:hypothetical protein
MSTGKALAAPDASKKTGNKTWGGGRQKPRTQQRALDFL